MHHRLGVRSRISLIDSRAKSLTATFGGNAAIHCYEVASLWRGVAVVDEVLEGSACVYGIGRAVDRDLKRQGVEDEIGDDPDDGCRDQQR